MSRKIFTTVILAMSADGKISDAYNSGETFGSQADKSHLEKQVALADAIIFGANTLRNSGRSLPIKDRELLNLREEQNKSPQSIHIVCSSSGKIDSELRFFSQNIPRWLITTEQGKKLWEEKNKFDRILVIDNNNWSDIFEQLSELGIEKLAILGGGELVASFLESDLIDEFWLTVCPLIVGGTNAPTPVRGQGFLLAEARKLKLIEMSKIGEEIFLNYRVIR